MHRTISQKELSPISTLLTSAEAWSYTNTQMIDRGPCECALRWLKTHPLPEKTAFVKPKAGGMIKFSTAPSAPSVHIDLPEKFLQIIHSILLQQNHLLRHVLCHQNLHKGNTFVKDGKISNLIDWQATWRMQISKMRAQKRLVQSVE
ncbi:hypothetical protein GQ44DRAFT_833180 [Phaeosphaeriaceae sp. PMI808]|nr:hypothetical protein GQ44DRAFT_833180 [Phaeosphaeriaceae sp. PMI808]